MTRWWPTVPPLIGTPERLDLLALLSLADMVATGPKGYQKWRDTPVIALSRRIRHLLEKGEPSRRPSPSALLISEPRLPEKSRM